MLQAERDDWNVSYELGDTWKNARKIKLKNSSLFKIDILVYPEFSFKNVIITQTTVSSFAVMLLLCIAGIVLGSNLQKRPSRRQVLVEKGVTMLYGMVEDTMGKHNSYWTPYIGALFLSSIFGSYIGMTGIFRSSTADLSHHRYLGLNDKRDLLGLLH